MTKCNHDALFLITARGGSKGILGKNIKLLNGKPLIQYSIDVARGLADDSDICVSTDSEKIKSVVESIGLEVPFMRPAELASDTASSNDVILHALSYYRDKGIDYRKVVLLQPTSPLRRSEDISGAMKLYSSDIDMVVSVENCDVVTNICNEDENGFLKFSLADGNMRRQDAEGRYYMYNGAVYVINADSIISKGMNGFDRVRKYVMSQIDSVDIDTMSDWMIAESLLKQRENGQV